VSRAGDKKERIVTHRIWGKAPQRWTVDIFVPACSPVNAGAYSGKFVRRRRSWKQGSERRGAKGGSNLR
jgi:hypothetical protein